MATPNLDLETVPSNSLQPSIPINDALQVIDALLGPYVIVQDKDLTTPPTTVGGDVGKRWIVATGATGAWAGHDGEIALCTAATLWRFFEPAEAWRAEPIDEDIAYRYSGSAWVAASTVASVNGDSGVVTVLAPIIVAVSDETSVLTVGTAKVTFRMPYAMTLTEIPRASLTGAPTGSALTVDINEAGASILSTKLTIDAGEKTSTTAATPAVLSDTSLANDAEITIDIDGVGSSSPGTGLKVTLIGYAS